MKIEERQIKATFFAGCTEWCVKLIFEHVVGYNPLWIQMLGALGTGLIIYAMWHYGLYIRDSKQKK